MKNLWLWQTGGQRHNSGVELAEKEGRNIHHLGLPRKWRGAISAPWKGKRMERWFPYKLWGRKDKNGLECRKCGKTRGSIRWHVSRSLNTLPFYFYSPVHSEFYNTTVSTERSHGMFCLFFFSRSNQSWLTQSVSFACSLQIHHTFEKYEG